MVVNAVNIQYAAAILGDTNVEKQSTVTMIAWITKANAGV